MAGAVKDATDDDTVVHPRRRKKQIQNKVISKMAVEAKHRRSQQLGRPPQALPTQKMVFRQVRELLCSATLVCILAHF